jgi:glutaredoxin
VFVADLRNARPDGTYAVRETTRADFDALALGRRQKRGLTLASPWDAGALSAPTTGPDLSQPSNAPVDPGVAAPVVIYGASWCGACHKAAEYLRQKGIPFVEKDIEQDAAAAREMQRKLVRNGLRGGSIPVIDVRGKVMVGFNPAEVDAALGKAS